MANRLKMAEIHAILTLRVRGWLFRRIGRELGVYRETAARYVRLAEACSENNSGNDSGPNLPAGSDDQNRPKPPTGSGPQSLAEPHRAFIVACLDRGLSGQRIWQDLKTEHAFEGSYDSIKRFARRLKTHGRLPFRRM